MRSLQVSKHQTFHTGFTLVEMLVVAPIAILSIGIIVSVTISMVGDAMISQARATAAYTTQDALDRIEKDIRLSSAFLSTFSSVQPGQGKNATPALMTDTTSFSTSSNTASDTLILNSPATTSDPYDSGRALVYYKDQPNACGGASTNLNRPLTTRVIYFLRTQNSVTTLWRRTVVPIWNTSPTVDANTVCNAPWQRDSCPTTNGSDCQANDEKMIDNVSAFTLTYYTASGATTTNSRMATNVKVLLKTSQSVAGSTVIQANTLRATRTNETTDAIPAAPTVSVLNPSINSDNNPTKTTFGWNAVPYAGYYKIAYTINGTTTNATTTSTSYVVATKPLDIVSVTVRAVNDMGESPPGTFSLTTPLWTVPNLNSGWTSWGTGTSTGHTQAAYTITPGGTVMIKGMMQKATTVSNGETIFTLPVGLRPTAQLIYGVKAGSLSNNIGRLDIDTAGNVMLINVANASSWVTIDGIMFAASGYGTWTMLAPGSGYSNYGNVYSNLGYQTDTYAGRVNVQGLIKGDGGAISPGLPSIGSLTSHVRTIGAVSTDDVFGINQSGSSVSPRGSSSSTRPTAWHSLQFTYYPNQGSGWTALTLQNSWVAYPAAGWETPGYRKGADGIVSLKGLIWKSTGSSGEVIFNLPAGYRPRQTWFMPAYTGCNTAGLLYIAPDGNVYGVYGWGTSINNSCTSLDNIHFMAEQ